MSYRFMRVMLFFDLPTITSADRRNYTQFRKHLLKSGFMMLQESVYCKLALNQTVTDGIVKSIRNNKPPAGVVQVICITEKQFEKMEFIVGEHKSDVIDTDERLVII